MCSGIFCIVLHNAYYSISRFSNSMYSLVQFVVFFSRQIYIYIYHCLYCHASWSRTFEIVFFLFPFHEIFNEGTKEKKSTCMYVAFAYDLILLFFVTWVSQIYLVSNIESIHKEHRWSRGWNLDEESGSKNRYLDP